MKKILVFLAALLLFAVNVNAECTIRFRVREAPPAYQKEASGKWSGFVVLQAEALLKEIGCKIIYLDMPWKRALLSLEEGSLDMLAHMSKTEDREKYTVFIGPHRFEKMRLIVDESSNYHIQTHEDLKKLPGKISLIRGLWYGPEMEKMLDDPTFQKQINWVSGSKLVNQEVERLRLGRIKAVVYPEYFIKDMAGVKYHPFIINSNPVYFGFSKKSVDEELLTILQKAAKDLLANGTFEHIENSFR